MCFVWIREQTAIISLYSINWLVCITETECVYCAVQTGSLYTASLTFSNSTFCPHSVFMCFVWIWEQTAIISLYSINWLVYITETESVYCAVRTALTFVFKVWNMLKNRERKLKISCKESRLYLTCAKFKELSLSAIPSAVPHCCFNRVGWILLGASVWNVCHRNKAVVCCNKLSLYNWPAAAVDRLNTNKIALI